MSLWGKLVSKGIWGDVKFGGSSELQFRDTGLRIYSSADGKLVIASDGTGSDDITIIGSITGTGDQAITGDITLTGNLTVTGDISNIDIPIIVTDAAAYSLTAANSGKTHLLPDMSAACTISPPANTAGLRYRFVYTGGAEDAHGIVIDLGADANFFIGGVTHLDSNADAAGDEVVSVFSDGDSNSILTASTVGPGSWIEIFCDGTNWYVTGVVVGATAPAFSDQA